MYSYDLKMRNIFNRFRGLLQRSKTNTANIFIVNRYTTSNMNRYTIKSIQLPDYQSNDIKVITRLEFKSLIAQILKKEKNRTLAK